MVLWDMKEYFWSQLVINWWSFYHTVERSMNILTQALLTLISKWNIVCECGTKIVQCSIIEYSMLKHSSIAGVIWSLCREVFPRDLHFHNIDYIDYGGKFLLLILLLYNFLTPYLSSFIKLKQSTHHNFIRLIFYLLRGWINFDKMHKSLPKFYVERLHDFVHHYFLSKNNMGQ